MVRFKLLELLEEKELNQKQLSELTGIGKNAINRYCNHTWQKANKNDIDILCRFFNCKINDLIECRKEDV